MVASLFQLGTLHKIGMNLDRQLVLDGPVDTQQLALGRKVAGDDNAIQQSIALYCSAQQRSSVFRFDEGIGVYVLVYGWGL